MGNKHRLLMVEDSQTLAAIYASYLSGREFELCIVDSLARARDEWPRFNPDIVLLDVELPDGHGLDLLRNRPDAESVPEIVVMTAFGSSASSAASSLSSGMSIVSARRITTRKDWAESSDRNALPLADVLCVCCISRCCAG